MKGILHKFRTIIDVLHEEIIEMVRNQAWITRYSFTNYLHLGDTFDRTWAYILPGGQYGKMLPGSCKHEYNKNVVV